MSQSRFAIVPTAAIMDASLTATQMRVLMVLATFSDNENKSWPSQKKLGELAGFARETVNRAIKGLVERGYVKSVSRYRSDGSRTSNVYMVMLDGEIPDSIPCDDDVTPGVTLGDHPGCDPIESHHEDTQLNTTIEHHDVGSVVTQIWDLAPQPAKTRSSKKLVKAAVEKALKTVSGQDLVQAWRTYLASPDAVRDGGKFVPGIDRWIRDQKYEAWLPKTPELFDVEHKAITLDDLVHAFRVLRDHGEWLGERYGYTRHPSERGADYPPELYTSFNIKKPEEV